MNLFKNFVKTSYIQKIDDTLKIYMKKPTF